MNDEKLDTLVRDAFDGVQMPDEAKQGALRAIEALQVSAAPDHENVLHAFFAPKRHHRGWFISAAAACLILVAALFGVQHINSTPTAFVDIDMNPSIELQVNRFDKVIGTQAMNDDGSMVLADLDLKGLPYEQAIAELTASAAFAAYLTPDSFVQFSVVTDSQSQQQALMTASEACIATLPCQSACESVTQAARAEAHDHGMGCGRYTAAQELMALDSTVTLEECETLSMRELRDRIDACEGHGQSNGQGQGSGQNHGWGYGYGYGQDQGTGQGHDSGQGHRYGHHG